MQAILVLNAGSSSIKFAAYDPLSSSGALALICSGHVSQSADGVEMCVRSRDHTVLEQVHWTLAQDVFDRDEAMTRLLTWLDAHRGGLELAGIGHRVVHGGEKYLAPVLVSDKVMADLEALVPLAPLHQPHNLKAMQFLRERLPDVPQVACFDTAFHGTQLPVARAFALPRRLSTIGLRRYGFHGLSCEYVASQLPRVLGEHASGKVIVAHLGNGASLCALQDGKSVASTTGFSTLDGLMMGTRCGTLDAGAVLYLLQQLNMSVDEVSHLLYNESGLLGVSGLTGDMQSLLVGNNTHAAEAIDLFVYRIISQIGALAAVMGGLDALVFTAGIGEHAAVIRARICAGCAWLGAVLDDTANSADLELIHAHESDLRLAVVPTDEELMIAIHTQRCVMWPQQEIY